MITNLRSLNTILHIFAVEQKYAIFKLRRFVIMAVFPGASCGMPVIGSHPSGSWHWDERNIALANGPITVVRVWTNHCGIEGYVQVIP